jgi:hypothetical protein
MTWMRHLPLLIVFISFSTILFEIYFPVLVWVKGLRKYLLIGGVLFHLGIGVVMALWSFAFLMMTPYLLFIPEAVTDSWLQKAKRKFVSF